MSNPSRTISVSARSGAVKNPLSLPARIGVLLLGLMLSSLALVAPASAATITVGNAGDPATGNAAKCNAASTCTLRDAIAKAANATGTATGDTIVFSLPANSTITLSGRELLVDRNLIIDGSGNLAISGNNASRAFEISAGVVATLKQLVIKNGNNSDNGGGIYNSGALTLVGSTVSGNTGGIGGGISSNDGATLTLTNSTVSGNMAYVAGGIANHSGSLTLTNSSIVNNTARSSGGGGIFNTSGRLTLTNSTVANNTAISGGGIENMSGPLVLTGSTISGNSPGGIANYYGIASLTDSVISSNTAPRDAGGIYNKGIMTLTRCTIAGNTAIISDFYGSGGGIYNSGTLTLASSTVWGNAVSGSATTSGSGGGISNSDGASLTLTDSTISYNRAGGDYGSGGGISSGGGLTLTNTTVSGNTTGSHGVGGGIAGSSLTLVNSTVSGNTAGSHGGGIYTAGSTLIHGTIANNTAAGSSSDVYNRNVNHLPSISAVNTIIQSCETDGIDSRALVDNGGNLDGGNGCGFTKASSKSNAALDLGPLADNDGPTLTMMPRSDSAAIGHGVRSVCDVAPVSSKDQRGVTRSTTACTSGAVDPNGLINVNQRGLSGSWADPTVNGQGILMDIGPDFYGAGTALLFAGWYAYDVTAAGGQRWYTLQGQVSGTAPASVGIYSTTGGRFHSAQATSTNEVGRATLAFSDCTHGTLTYTFTDGSGRSGRIPLTRLLSNATCSPSGDSGNTAAATLLSGAWADTAFLGQGMVFDISAKDNVVFAGWYTYSPTGASNSGAAGQRWYTLQATLKPGTSTPNSVDIYESTGGVFNAPTNVRTTQVGTASLVFNSCTSATLKYTFTAGANSGRTGTLDLTRIGAAPSGCHL